MEMNTGEGQKVILNDELKRLIGVRGVKLLDFLREKGGNVEARLVKEQFGLTEGSLKRFITQMRFYNVITIIRGGGKSFIVTNVSLPGSAPNENVSPPGSAPTEPPKAQCTAKDLTQTQLLVLFFLFSFSPLPSDDIVSRKSRWFRARPRDELTAKGICHSLGLDLSIVRKTLKLLLGYGLIKKVEKKLLRWSQTNAGEVFIVTPAGFDLIQGLPELQRVNLKASIFK